MPKPRSSQVSLEDTPFYHCVSRTVRRAFLCGIDNYSGQSFEHRRGWVEDRLLLLTSVFAIDIAAYAVMSNHLHIVLRIDSELAQAWTSIDVVNQWHQLFKGTLLTQKFAKGDAIESYEIETLNETIAEYRRRLMDISWFMRALNEPIARQANKEDNCTGRFWEGRFKSQALLDEAAVLACMAYVDLNPIRANMADTPEHSDFTSIQRRIKAAFKGLQSDVLLPFVGNERKNMPNGLMFDIKDYLELVDDTGRVIRDDKRGAIKPGTVKILNRLNIPLENWLKVTSEFKYLFKGPVGTLEELTRYCEHLDKKRIANASSCRYWHS
ncbi:transposase [Shewanella canadensis]|uniref:Transposase n=1 Tax=Shewanella canadensis TaxID=271096 RepID=A0A3S0RW15_9GAMM|nr:transposase [Shewanella canadensis]RTR37566.1 transposase [Shewanella canadensis]